jgi:hypothetical protein
VTFLLLQEGRISSYSSCPPCGANYLDILDVFCSYRIMSAYMTDKDESNTQVLFKSSNTSLDLAHHSHCCILMI